MAKKSYGSLRTTTINIDKIEKPSIVAEEPVKEIKIEPASLNTKVGYKKLKDNAKVPTHGSDAAAGYDLYAAIDEEILIPAHQTKKIGTGLSIELPVNTFGAIFARSGLATNEGLRPANCTGVVDSDYRGEVIVALHNDSPSTKIVRPGDRIAQLVVLPFISIEFTESSELSETERGNGGFGSTGK